MVEIGTRRGQKGISNRDTNRIRRPSVSDTPYNEFDCFLGSRGASGAIIFATVFQTFSWEGSWEAFVGDFLDLGWILGTSWGS